MEIIRAKVLGFCFGVRRTVELAEKALQENQEKKVYSLGPLIHNEEALKTLEEKGLQIAGESEILKIQDNSVVIIRAHGVAPVVINKLKEKNCQIIDATCPRVKASQKLVEQYTSHNDYVILTGDRNHGEVQGIAGYAGKNFIQIQNKEEAEQLNLQQLESASAILLSQTTYSNKEFADIEAFFKSRIKNITVFNTICPATKERQDSLKELCSQVDGVLVVGGQNSSNTKRLYQTARENCKYAAHIQTENDIPEIFYKLNKIGITAGASTPDSIIDKVQRQLQL